MSTNREPIRRDKKPPTTFAPEIIRLFKLAREIQEHPDANEKWEAVGGRRREYLDTCHALHYALGRNTADECIMCTIGHDEPAEWMIKQQPNQVPSWWSAHALDVALQHCDVCGTVFRMPCDD